MKIFIYFLVFTKFLIKIFSIKAWLKFTFVKNVFSIKKFSCASDCGTSSFFTFQPPPQKKAFSHLEKKYMAFSCRKKFLSSLLFQRNTFKFTSPTTAIQTLKFTFISKTVAVENPRWIKVKSFFVFNQI